MIFFILGIIIGILLSFLIFLSYIFFTLRGKNKIHQSIQKVEEKARPQARIFMPPTLEQEAIETILDKNAKKWQDTSGEEIGL